MAPGQPGAPDEIAAGSPDRARRRPALRAAGRVAGALVVAALVLSAADVGPLDLPVGTPLSGSRPEETAPLPLAITPTGAPASAPPRNGVDWGTRGDLVGAEGFVAAAVARIREARPRADRLYFVGRLPDGSRLVVAGTDVNAGMVATAVHVLRVLPGRRVGAAPVVEGPTLGDPQEVWAWAAPAADRSGTVALALTRPGPVRFGFSPRVTFGDDGTVRRPWQTVFSDDGTAVTDLGQSDPTVVVRARAPGVFGQPVAVRVRSQASAAEVLVLTPAEPEYRGPDRERLGRALASNAGAVVDLTTARPEVIWSGVPWKQRRLALVLLTRPDGRQLQALVGQDGEQVFSAGTRVLPTGADPRLPWLLEPFSPQDPTLLLCPTGPGTLRYERKGRPAQRLPVSDQGVAALVAPGPSAPSASGARVTLFDPSGRELLSTVLPPRGFDDILGLR